MRFFFRSKTFKIILSVFIGLIALSLLFALIGTRLSPQADLFGSVAAPIKTVATGISDGVSSFFEAFKNGNEAILKNAELESEINDLRESLAEYETAIKENEFYKNYLEIKDAHPDFKFTAATLISRDKNDPFGGFVINKGSLDGIAKNDPVITDAGLVGFVSQVGTKTSKVMTILDPDITLGALDNRTDDSGILHGALKTAQENLTGFYNLSRSCNVAVGDYIVTSGEGIFPSGLLIGTVKTIGSEKYNTSIYATVEPFVDFDAITGVMVITEFEGQGGLNPEK